MATCLRCRFGRPRSMLAVFWMSEVLQRKPVSLSCSKGTILISHRAFSPFVIV
jgi:hypothetical protein